jgi:hypothetical protein
MDQLDAVESAVEEQEQIAEANVALELRLHDHVQTVDAFSHVDVFRVQKNPGRTERRRKRGWRHDRAPGLASGHDDLAERRVAFDAASADALDEAADRVETLRGHRHLDRRVEAEPHLAAPRAASARSLDSPWHRPPL